MLPFCLGPSCRMLRRGDCPAVFSVSLRSWRPSQEWCSWGSLWAHRQSRPVLKTGHSFSPARSESQVNNSPTRSEPQVKNHREEGGLSILKTGHFLQLDPSLRSKNFELDPVSGQEIACASDTSVGRRAWWGQSRVGVCQWSVRMRVCGGGWWGA